jgi:integrase
MRREHRRAGGGRRCDCWRGRRRRCASGFRCAAGRRACFRELLGKLHTSDFCKKHDLIDPITLLIATGLRRSELLGLRWIDFNEKANMLAVTGKVIRVPGEGLLRVDETKSAAGRRTIPLPKFAVEILLKRRQLPYLGEQIIIFPSTAGTLRDPNNFGKEWRTARQELGVAEVTTHSFRKTVATLIDDDGLSARIGADHLGHSHVSMTQDRYMTRVGSTPRLRTCSTVPSA